MYVHLGVESLLFRTDSCVYLSQPPGFGQGERITDFPSHHLDEIYSTGDSRVTIDRVAPEATKNFLLASLTVNVLRAFIQLVKERYFIKVSTCSRSILGNRKNIAHHPVAIADASTDTNSSSITFLWLTGSR